MTSPAPLCNPWAVVVSWNVADLLPDCFNSLAAAEPPLAGIVVVDNASSDDTCHLLRRDFPAVRLIANDSNAGFGTATNQGVRAALASGADSLLLLNPDASLEPAALATLLDSLNSSPASGIVAPAIVNADGTPQPYAFGGDPTLAYLLRRGSARLLRRGYLHDWGSTDELTPDWVTGACLLARAEIFKAGIWFDENFFLYFEDNDWCLRTRQAGWQIRRVPAARACHVGGASLTRNPAARRAYRRSLLYFYARHYPAWQRFCLRLLLPLYARAASC